MTSPRILVVEDDPTFMTLLKLSLESFGEPFQSVTDGTAAWQLLSQPHTFQVVILDWNLPGLSGLEICQKVRALPTHEPPYIVLLTGNDRKEDVVKGLKAGADDYMTKPFHRDELSARLNVGKRIAQLQRTLTSRVKELETALKKVTELEGLIPICAYCKKVRDDKNYWHQVEEYVSVRSGALFSHGVCPICAEKLLENFKKKQAAG